MCCPSTRTVPALVLESATLSIDPMLHPSILLSLAVIGIPPLQSPLALTISCVLSSLVLVLLQTVAGGTCIATLWPVGREPARGVHAVQSSRMGQRALA